MHNEVPDLMSDCKSAMTVTIHGFYVYWLLDTDTVFKGIHFSLTTGAFIRLNNFVTETREEFRHFEFKQSCDVEIVDVIMITKNLAELFRGSPDFIFLPRRDAESIF